MKWHSTISGTCFRAATASGYLLSSERFTLMNAHTLSPIAEGLITILEPDIIPIASIFFTLWCTAAPEIPHPRAISRYGILALLTRKESIFLSVSSIW